MIFVIDFECSLSPIQEKFFNCLRTISQKHDSSPVTVPHNCKYYRIKIENALSVSGCLKKKDCAKKEVKFLRIFLFFKLIENN
jgi:hypothetical protein